MEKYILKSALEAEIERRLRELSQLEKASYEIGLYDAYKIVLSFLDTIEVKEVDLEKEFSKWWKGEKAKDYNVDILYERYSNVSMKLAKHFFELGMQVSNKGCDKEIEL